MNRIGLFIWMLILTLLAGAVNTLAVCYYGTTVSHVTGLVSNFSLNIFKNNWENVLWFFSVIASFFVGAIIAGVITVERAFYLHKRYGWIIISIGLFLGAGVLIFSSLNANDKHIICLFALLMGLQNGMVVAFRGVVVRMTHMSGNLTDLGVFIGYKIRRNKNEKAISGLVPAAALIGFILGGIVAMGLYELIEIYSFYVIAAIYVVLGGVYFILQKRCIDKDFNGIPDHLE